MEWERSNDIHDHVLTSYEVAKKLYHNLLSKKAEPNCEYGSAFRVLESLYRLDWCPRDTDGKWRGPPNLEGVLLQCFPPKEYFVKYFVSCAVEEQVIDDDIYRDFVLLVLKAVHKLAEATLEAENRSVAEFSHLDYHSWEVVTAEEALQDHLSLVKDCIDDLEAEMWDLYHLYSLEGTDEHKPVTACNNMLSVLEKYSELARWFGQYEGLLEQEEQTAKDLKELKDQPGYVSYRKPEKKIKYELKFLD